MNKLESVIKNIIVSKLEKLNLPENFYDIAIDVYPFLSYGNTAKITVLMKKPFSASDSDFFDYPLYEIRRILSIFLKDKLPAGLSSSISTIEEYNKNKEGYDKMKSIKESRDILISEGQLKNLIKSFK